MVINQAVEATGLAGTQRLGTLLDGISRHTPEGQNFKNRVEGRLTGQCSSGVDTDRLTADEFANKVLIAEGFVAEHEVKWQRDLRRRFVTEFGAALVSSKDFG